jgi:hypothetical protein
MCSHHRGWPACARWEVFSYLIPPLTCRFALLSLAACEAALQLQLPTRRAVLPRWDQLDEQGPVHWAESSTKVKQAAPYSEILGKEKCSTMGEEVVFVANDWHAGVPTWCFFSARVVNIDAGQSPWVGTRADSGDRGTQSVC